MERLYYCEAELRSLADLEKFNSITITKTLCENVPEVNTEEIVRYIEAGASIYVSVAVSYYDMSELKKWFRIRNTREAVCLDDILYTKF